MQITKFGHSCVLVQDGQTKILFDPGIWSDIPKIRVDAIVVTHLHADHLGLEKHYNLFKSAPRIITQDEVKKVLDQQDIPCEVVKAGQTIQVNSFTLEALGTTHALIHPGMPKFKNTGFLINGKVFHPGDSFTLPKKAVDVLLLPLTAPWSKVSETVSYIGKVKAKNIFAIHDAFLNETGLELYGQYSNAIAQKYGGKFIQPKLGKKYEI